jgi:hypothetical protein
VGARLERHEAVELLKVLVANNLARPSLIALKESNHDNFDLILKGDVDVHAISKLVASKGLTVKEDKAKEYCIIC